MGFSFLTQELAMDLGTANTVIFQNDKIVLDEPSIVAIDSTSGKCIALGHKAKLMHGKEQPGIRTIRPLRDGVIADFQAAEMMIRGFIKQVNSTRHSFLSPNLRLVVGIPSGSTEVELRAVRDSAEHAGGRDVYLISEPMAAALGIGLEVEAPKGSMVVDIGGGTTEIAVISLGGIVVQDSIRTAGGLDDFGTIDLSKILNIVALVVSLAVVIYGSIKLGWDMPEMAAMFIWLAIVVGIISGFDTDTICKTFLEGCKKMMSAMIIIGLAQSISAIMKDGKIIDTVVHALAGGLGSVPALLQAPAMLIANTIINVFLTSGSGQAAAVMPIMVPLSDLIGVTRQTAVLAFNFGDGFCNYILPTSTALMGIISACNIPYDRWMRFMWKMFAVWMVVGTVMLIIAQIIHLGPM